ncbi:MAG: hypothetical protein Q9171_003165 [Xanthocarpia ochracea]
MPSITEQRNGPALSNLKKHDRDAASNGTDVGTKGTGHGDTFHEDDNFHHLPKPQQDILLLHGPRQNGAAIGVAFISVLLALGISLGFNFANVAEGPPGPDLLTTTRESSLQQSKEGNQTHLEGLTGLPKTRLPSIRYHNVPIKVFHHAPLVGERAMSWLEGLLVANALIPQEFVIVAGGREGINGALDQLKKGIISGKRLVVPIEFSTKQDEFVSNGVSNGVNNGVADSTATVGSLEYTDKLNSSPSRIKFAYWVPNVSGGLVISKIEQWTKWDFDSNAGYAQTAERYGFEYALTQIRLMAGYGADNQHESVTFSQAILHHTKRLIVMAALLPGPWNPAIAAKQIASIDNYSNGHIAVNVVSGWFKQDFTSIGQCWLEYAEWYRRSREFIACLKGIWTEDQFSFKGNFYQFHDYPLKPKPVSKAGRPWPDIFQRGRSIDAGGFQTQIADVKKCAKQHGREGQVRLAVNWFVIARETEEEAIRVLQGIQGKAKKEAVEAFGDAVKNAGASTANKMGMWADSKSMILCNTMTDSKRS